MRSRPLVLAVLALGAAVLLGATACSDPGPAARRSSASIDGERCARNADAGRITYVSGYGYSASAGQMDVILAEELGYFDDLCLDVEINAAGGNGQQLVSAGRAQFTALGSASDVMLAAANSGNLTAIAAYGTTSPFSIFANERITDLKQLEGGRLGYFINLTPIASAMLGAAGVDVSKVELVKMTNYDPTVVTRGQVDAIVGYASNQPERLRAMGEPFTEFLPADFGLTGTYNVMEVNSGFLREHRGAVADFMRASLHALQGCLADEAGCVERISRLAEENGQGEAFPADQQARTWRVESQWVRDSAAGPPGVMSESSWEAEAGLVTRFGGLDDAPAIANMTDMDLVRDLYRDGALEWPGASG